MNRHLFSGGHRHKIPPLPVRFNLFIFVRDHLRRAKKYFMHFLDVKKRSGRVVVFRAGEVRVGEVEVVLKIL